MIMHREYDGPEPEMTVVDLLKIAAYKGIETKTDTVTLDLPPNDELGLTEPVMITFSFGKEARNNMARLLNTFLEMEEDEDA